jgi:hypothetical protein
MDNPQHADGPPALITIAMVIDFLKDAPPKGLMASPSGHLEDIQPVIATFSLT